MARSERPLPIRQIRQSTSTRCPGVATPSRGAWQVPTKAIRGLAHPDKAILHLSDDKNVKIEGDATTIALRALAHVAGDPDLGPRFLALSGLDAHGLRGHAADPALLAAVIDFLEGREADLIACAEALDIKPATLVAAGRSLAA